MNDADKSKTVVSTEPYFLKSEECFVAYLDVLGFREILEKPEIIQNYYRSIRQATDQIDASMKKKTVQSKMLGDAVVFYVAVGMSLNEQILNLRNLLMVVAQVQFNLAIQNIWTRGGVTGGKMQSDDTEFITGDALARAYDLEGLSAIYPRTVVDPKIIQHLTFEEGIEPFSCHELILKINEQTHEDTSTSWNTDILFDWSRKCYRAGVKATDYLDKDVPLFVDYVSPIQKKADANILADLYMHLTERTQGDVKYYNKYRWVSDYLMAHCAHVSEFSNAAAFEKLGEL